MMVRYRLEVEGGDLRGGDGKEVGNLHFDEEEFALLFICGEITANSRSKLILYWPDEMKVMLAC